MLGEDEAGVTIERRMIQQQEQQLMQLMQQRQLMQLMQPMRVMQLMQQKGWVKMIRV